jgi:hypothetical protein
MDIVWIIINRSVLGNKFYLIYKILDIYNFLW